MYSVELGCGTRLPLFQRSRTITPTWVELEVLLRCPPGEVEAVDSAARKNGLACSLRRTSRAHFTTLPSPVSDLREELIPEIGRIVANGEVEHLSAPEHQIPVGP
jgi:hypothetical protein